MLHGNVFFREFGVFAQNTTESAFLFVFKKCPLSTQTFLHTFWQNGHALA